MPMRLATFGLIDTSGTWSAEPQLLRIGEPVGDLYPAHGSPAIGFGPVSEAYDNASATFDKYYEATTGAIDAKQLQYLMQSGIDIDTATALIIGAAAAPIIARLPMEFLVESKQLIQMALSH